MSELEWGVLAERDLGDGRILQVVPLGFGRARLHIGPKGVMWYQDGW